MPAPPRPSLSAANSSTVAVEHETLGKRYFHCLPSEDADAAPELMFTENDTNYERLWGGENASPYVKDAFHNHVIGSSSSTTPCINPAQTGTKSGAHYTFTAVPGNGSTAVVRIKLTRSADSSEDVAVADAEAFDETIAARKAEADDFYSTLDRDVALCEDLKNVNRQALSGMLW